MEIFTITNSIMSKKGNGRGSRQGREKEDKEEGSLGGVRWSRVWCNVRASASRRRKRAGQIETIGDNGGLAKEAGRIYAEMHACLCLYVCFSCGGT